MQNPINGWSRACYTPMRLSAILLMLILLFLSKSLSAQSSIRIAKDIVGIDHPQSGVIGNFNVTFDLIVENTGTNPLQNIQINDQLDAASQYGAVFQSIVTAPSIVISTAMTTPSPNSNYDGRLTQPNLLLGGGVLQSGQSFTVRFTAEVNPNANGSANNVTNQATVFATDGTANISDLSDSGTIPNSNNLGERGDTGGSDDPTPLTNCFDNVQPFVCNETVNLSLNANCIAVLNVDNLIELEDDAEVCYDDDDYPLGGYYRIRIKTLDGLLVEDMDVTTVNTIEFDASPYDAVMAEVANIVEGNTCWIRVNLDDKQAPICTPENDLEALINLDNIDQNEDGNLIDDIDPSGRDDLQDEYIICTLIEEFGSEPYFDVLEAEDFTDCSSVRDIIIENEIQDICDVSDLSGTPVDMTRFDNTKYQIVTVYTRTWSAFDENGFSNDNACQQRVFALRPIPAGLQINPNATTDCEADLEQFYTDAAPYFEVAGGDVEIINRGEGTGILNNNTPQKYPLNEGLSCNYLVSLTEGENAQLCGGSFKKFRSYSVLDRCTQAQVFDNFQQILKVEDTTGPTFENIPDFSLSMQRFSCSAEGSIPTAILSDNCSHPQVTRVLVDRLFPSSSNSNENFIGSIENGGSVNDLGLTQGTYTLTYIAADGCNNTSELEVVLTVEDRTTPIAVCDDELNISLISTGNGAYQARLNASDLDEGSQDNCYPVIFQVRSTNNASIIDDQFGDFAEFSCADAGRDDLMAEMLIIEDRDGDGRYPDDDGGLVSTCMAMINIEDKAAPEIYCTDLTVDCSDPTLQALLDPSRTDLNPPTFNGGCPGANTELSLEIIDEDYAGSCAAGTFIRRFTATRRFNGFNRSSTCDQLVTVDFQSDWTMTFPPDYIIDCSNGENVPPALEATDILDNDGCDTWGMEVTEEVFDFASDGGCQKIIRTYSFVNWCTWMPNATESGRVNRPVDLIIEETDRVQLTHRSKNFAINELDDKDDIDPYDEEEDFEGRLDTDGALVLLNGSGSGTKYDPFYFLDDEELNGRPSVRRVDANNYGYFTYTQIIKIVDNQRPMVDPIANFEVRNIDEDCTTDVVLPAPGVVECKDNYEVSYDAGTLGSGRFAGFAPNLNPITLRNVPISDAPYPVSYTVTDGCGNSTTINYNFTVVDATPPTARCVVGLNISLGSDQREEIWATDFDFSSSDACGEIASLTFADPRLFPDSTTLVVTCADRGSNEVSLWVMDAAGNVSTCVSILTVQDGGLCQTRGAIQGNIATEMGGEVESVAVHLEGPMYEMNYTDVTGNFAFEEVPEGYSLSLQPEKREDPLNGVTTQDLIYIRKHILGLENFTTPYQLLAADVNNSGDITTYDLVLLRKIILGITDEFEGNDSWRFIAQYYQFPEPTNPWLDAFPELFELDNFTDNELNANFIAIKTGDVNYSAVPNSLVTVDERSTLDPFLLDMNVEKLQGGNSVRINFTSEQLDDLEGLQFSLNFDPQLVELEMIEPGLLKLENINYAQVDRGRLTFSWDKLSSTNNTLFGLVFATDIEIDWADFFQLEEQRIPAEAYLTGTGGRVKVSPLALGEATFADNDFVLFQNKPNPFRNQTTISFYLPFAEKATFKVYSSTGQLIHTESANYDAGHNEILFDLGASGASGFLYYSLETPTFNATKKMSILK